MNKKLLIRYLLLVIVRISHLEQKIVFTKGGDNGSWICVINAIVED